MGSTLVGPMIQLVTEKGRFYLRAVAVAVQDGRVLLHRAGETYWSLPGGRAEIDESSDAAVVREMEEEARIRVKPVRLLWIHESFFPDERTRTPVHCLELAHLVQVPESHAPLRLPRFAGSEGPSTPLEFRWFALDELRSLWLCPAELPDLLARDPGRITHLVTRE